jgi:hypothetical protein
MTGLLPLSLSRLLPDSDCLDDVCAGNKEKEPLQDGFGFRDLCFGFVSDFEFRISLMGVTDAPQDGFV